MNLELAAVFGAFNVLVAGALFVTSLPSNRPDLVTPWDMLGWLVYAGIQSILVASASRAARIRADAGEPFWDAKSAILFAFVALLLLIFLASPVVLRTSQQPGFQAAAVGRLRTVNSGQAAYADAHPDRGYATTLDELREQRFVSPDIGVAEYEYGYRLSLSAGPRDPSGRIRSYQAWADKIPPQGRCRNFFTDEAGSVRFTQEKRPATAADSPIQ